MKTAGLFLLVFAAFAFGAERCAALFSERRAVKGALKLIRYLKTSLSDHAEVLPSVYSGFSGGIDGEFDRELRENGLEAAVNGTRLFHGEAGETMKTLAREMGTGSRETRLTLLNGAEEKMTEIVKKNDLTFPDDLKATAVWTFGAIGFLLIRFL